jgi:phosphatidylserine/phosphatidylglycerophosphate/cardiolipin synthase-like enzyme
MAEFLTTKGTALHLENIIKGANKELVLVSPYLQISKTFYERLLDASKRNVSIKIIYGKDELKSNEKNSLAELKNLELLYFENLHAKCYFNDDEMVITSMNMYEFSEKNNREMGVLVARNKDTKLFDDAVNEIHSIIRSSKVVKLSKPKRRSFQPKKKKSNRGYCIRCKDQINYDPEKPYCHSCFTIWYQFENPEYEEDVCHSCGSPEATSMIKPECLDCFKRNK